MAKDSIIKDKATLIDLLVDGKVATDKRDVFRAYALDNQLSPPSNSTTPQTTGGSVSAATKFVDRAPVDTGYDSARILDRQANYRMGGKDATGSFKEYTNAPKAAATGALDAVEGMAKSPFAMTAGYYNSKDTYLSKRESEGAKTLTGQVQERSQQYQKEHGAENTKKAEEWAKVADSIDLYKYTPSVRDFMNKTKEEMQDIKDETGTKFTLSDLAYTMGQMAPSIALGKVGSAVAGKLFSGTELGQAMAANFATNEALSNVGNLPEAAYDISEALKVARGMQTAAAVGEATKIGQTVGSIGSMFSQVYGNSFDEARQTGADAKTASEYALSHALVESGTELLGGGIPGMNEGVATKLVSNLAEKTAARFGGQATAALLPKALTTVGKLLSSPAGEMALDVIGEGVEEMISEVYDPWIAQTTIDPNRPDATFNDIALAGFMGMVTSAMMQGGVKIFKTAAENGQAYRYNEQTKKIEKPESVKRESTVTDTGLETKPDTLNGFEAAKQFGAEDIGKGVESTSASNTPASSVEAARNGAPSQTEEADRVARRAAKMYTNSLLEGALAGINAFSEGGAMFDRYSNVITPEMLRDYEADLSSIPRFLDESRDYSWEELDKFISEVAAPLLTASNIERLTYENMPGRVRVQSDGVDQMLNSKEYLDLHARKVFGAKSYSDLDEADKATLYKQFKADVDSGKQEVKDFVDNMNKILAPSGLQITLNDKAGENTFAFGYDEETKSIHVNPRMVFTADAARFFMGHELVHHALHNLSDADRKAFRRYTREAAAAVGVDLNDWIENYKGSKNYSEAKGNEEAYARFYSDLVGSPEMLADLAQNKPDVLKDIRDYMKAVSKNRVLPNRAARAAEAANIANVDAALNGTLEKKTAKLDNMLFITVPEYVKNTAAIPSSEDNTVETAQRMAQETAPSASAEEAKAKANLNTPSMEEVFASNAKDEVTLSAEAKNAGFQKLPATDGKGRTFQQALAGEGRSSRDNRARKAEKLQAETNEKVTVTSIPGLPNVSFIIVETGRMDVDRTPGKANLAPVRTIRAIPDDSHSAAQRGDYYLLDDAEKKFLKRLMFKDAGRGVFEHDYTPEFWNALRTSETEAIRSQSGAEEDREPFREYYSSVQKIRDSGAVFCFVPGAKGEQIKVYFRRADGSRTYGATLPKGTLKKYGFKYDKNNKNGPGFYVDYSDQLAEDLGLPATTKLMRERENTLLSVKRRMFKNETVACTGEGYVGMDLGYDPRTQTLYLYKNGVPVAAAPYSSDIIDKALGRSTLIEDTFKAKSDAKKRIDSIIKGIKDKPREFPGITETEEYRRNLVAEAKHAYDPLNAEEEERVNIQEQQAANRKDTVTIEFRDTDETVTLPISVLKQMTTLSEGKDGGVNLSWNGQMLDMLYWGKEDENVRFDPRTGEQRRLTGHEIPSKIIDNATGKPVWEAANYDETKLVPGEDIKLNREWFKKAFSKAVDLDAEQDKSAKESKARSEKEQGEYEAKQKGEELRKENEGKREAEEVRRSYEEGADLEAKADAYAAEAAVSEEEYYERMAADIEGIEKRERRGWRNNDVFFAQNQAEKRSRAEELWDQREKETRLSMDEVRRIKDAERAGAQSVDLSSMSAPELLNIFDTDAKKKGLVESLTKQRDQARQQGRFDDYAVIDKRLNEVNALIAEQARLVDKTTSSMPPAKDMSVIVKSREKRFELQAEARGLLEKVKDLEAKKADYEQKAEDAYKGWSAATEKEKSNINKKVKGLTSKAEKLDAQILELFEKAEKMTDEADAIKANIDQYYTAFEESQASEKKAMTAEEKSELSNRIREVSEQEEYTPVTAAEDHVNYDSAYTVDMEDDMLDVHPVEARLKDSDGVTLNPEQEQYYKNKDGAMRDGRVQKYYADYMDADNTEYGNGIIRLYLDPTDTDYQTDEVYAATERPIFYDDTVGDSTLTRELILESLSNLGIEDYSVSAELNPNTNLLEALQTIAEEAETADVTSAEIMDELLLNLGADCVILPDGMILFDERYIKSVHDMNPAVDNDMRAIRMDDNYFNELRRQWNVAQDKYGTIEGTDIPRSSSDDGSKVTTTMRQLTQNENTNVEGTPLDEATREAILKGMMDYAPMTDKKALRLVGNWLKKGNKGTAEHPDMMTGEDFMRKYDSWMKNGGAHDKVSVLKGGQLLAEMANFARENAGEVNDTMMKNWEALVANVALGGSRFGQGLQAYAALKKLTATGRLGYIEGMVEQIQNDLNSRKGVLNGKLKNVELEIPQEYIDQIKNAKSPEELDRIEDEICKAIASQIPATLESRLTAYRYLCMLGNIRTHLRNIASNVFMAGAKSISRNVSGGIQDIASIFSSKGERTVSAIHRANKAQKEFAAQDAIRNKEILQLGGKRGFESKVMQEVDDFGKPISPVQIGKFYDSIAKLFKHDTDYGSKSNMGATSAMNTDLLEFEDWKFLQREYRISLSRYMAANGFTPEYFNSNTKQALIDLNTAREYATQQAWAATYRNANAVANALNNIEKNGGSVARLIIEGLVPFKRTPMNVLMQGLHYSPVGIAEGLVKLGQSVTSGEVSAAEAVDRLAQGLTGSGAMYLGYFLASLGMMKAGGSDSDKEEYYDEMLGNQKYSISFNGKNYTIDWLTPVSMPIMAGVTLWGDTEGLTEDMSLTEKINWAWDAIKSTADPVTELSMLQGLTNTLNAYSQDPAPLQVATNAASSFALQFVPTVSGQALRTIDPVRRSTYAPKDSEALLGKGGEQFVNRLRNKSLIANKLLGDNNEYVDQWGRTEKNSASLFGLENIIGDTPAGEMALRAFNQFIAPWYVRDFNSTAVDDKIADIFARNGEDTSVMPSTPQSRFTIDKQSYYLSGDEYEKVKKTVGNLSYRGLEDAFAYKYFKYLDATAQTYVVDKVYDYAKLAAKADYANTHGLTLSSTDQGTIRKVTEAERNGIGVGQYYVIKQVVKDLKTAPKKQKLAEFGIPEELWELW